METFTTMKTEIILGSAVGAAVSGMFAAMYWHRSSNVNHYPEWSADKPKPVIAELKQMAINAALIQGLTKSAELNKTAALLTAVSVFLSVVSTIGGLAP